MLNCRKFTEQATEYMEGNLSFFQRIQFKLHAAMCGSCKEYLGQLRETVDLLLQLPKKEPGEEAPVQILQQFRDHHPPK